MKTKSCIMLLLRSQIPRPLLGRRIFLSQVYTLWFSSNTKSPTKTKENSSKEMITSLMLTKEKHYSPNSRGEQVSLIRSKSCSTVWDLKKKSCIRICSDCEIFLSKGKLIKNCLIIIDSICQVSV